MLIPTTGGSSFISRPTTRASSSCSIRPCSLPSPTRRSRATFLLDCIALHGAVRFQNVDFPAVAGWVAHPEFVLQGIAAGGVVLVQGAVPGIVQPFPDDLYFFRALHPQSHVAQ